MKQLSPLPKQAQDWPLTERIACLARTRLPFTDSWFECVCGSARFFLWHGSMRCVSCKTYYLLSPEALTLHRYRCLACHGRVFYRSRLEMLCAKCLGALQLRILFTAHLVAGASVVEALKKRGILTLQGERAAPLPSAGGYCKYADDAKAAAGRDPGVDYRKKSGPKRLALKRNI